MKFVNSPAYEHLNLLNLHILLLHWTTSAIRMEQNIKIANISYCIMRLHFHNFTADEKMLQLYVEHFGQLTDL